MQLFITRAVGHGKPNENADVRAIQILLNRHCHATSENALTTDGHFRDSTRRVIVAFQRKVLGMRHPDGIVTPTSATYEKLFIPTYSLHVPLLHVAEGNPRTRVLSEEQYAAAARELSCEVNAIKAIAAVETGKLGPFDDAGRPTILFERHKFSKWTFGKYNKSHPDICNPARGGYSNRNRPNEYPRLEAAMRLDEEAALLSASWGAFQIMGENYDQCGFDDVDSFVSAMRTSVDEHLRILVAFIQYDFRLLDAIRHKKWAKFAYAYNGSTYAENHYDVAMEDAYKAISHGRTYVPRRWPKAA